MPGLAKDAWAGPYLSSYGSHLIRLTGEEEGGLSELAQIRSAVSQEWTNERRQEADDRFFAALRARYCVEIRLPEKPASASKAWRRAADEGTWAPLRLARAP
jgi:hypothetical protein